MEEITPDLMVPLLAPSLLHSIRSQGLLPFVIAVQMTGEVQRWLYSAYCYCSVSRDGLLP